MKRLIVILLIALLVPSVAAQEGTLLAVAAGNEDFSTLVSLVEAAGLTETLNGEGPFTVFAPTNAAFEALPPRVVAYLGSAAGAETLTRILTYHVLPAQVMAADVTAALEANAGRFTAATVEGSELTLAANGEVVMVDQAQLVLTSLDIPASNGVIHVIDAVLVPPLELPVIFAAEVEGEIVTAGSSTVGPLSARIVDEFLLEGFAGEVTTDVIGTGAGFDRFCESGQTDIANASRPITDDEIAACAALDPARVPLEFRVGTDALAVVVNPQNNWATDMTLEELAQAFTTAETWADINPSWPERDIVRYSPDPLSGTFDYFVEEVLDEDADALLTASNLLMSPNDLVLEEGVEEDQFAIGYFGYAYYAENAEALRLLTIEGVEANAANVDNGTYPLARPLFIYSDAGIIAEKPQVGEFIKYYLSNVDRVIEEVGYFPANPFALNLARLSVLAAAADF